MQYDTRARSSCGSSQGSAFPYTVTGRRPILARASTTTAAVPRTSTDVSPSPLLSRPIVNRSVSATTQLRPSIERRPHRPSLLSRATDIISSTFEVSEEDSHASRHKPGKPTHWTDHAHRNALLRVWDAVQEDAGGSKYEKSISAQLVSTEKRMLQEFSELGEGGTLLSKEWMEYVLGVCMRHPFCTSRKMGRREVLASSGGFRGNWGPF